MRSRRGKSMITQGHGGGCALPATGWSRTGEIAVRQARILIKQQHRPIQYTSTTSNKALTSVPASMTGRYAVLMAQPNWHCLKEKQARDGVFCTSLPVGILLLSTAPMIMDGLLAMHGKCSKRGYPQLDTYSHHTRECLPRMLDRDQRRCGVDAP